MILLLFLGTLSLGLAAFLVAETATLPARRRREALNRVTAYGSGASASAASIRKRPSGGLLDPVWASVAAVVLRVMPRTTRESVDKRLIASGFARRITADQLMAAKGLLAAFGVLVGIVIISKNAAAGVLLTFCFGLLGFLGPDIVVNSRIRDRQDRVQASLPDALDLLAVSVEAGLSFEGAVAKLVEYMKGPLVEEFALTLNEIRVGEARADALKRMEARVDVPELTTFVRAVVQAEQLGTSMAAILRAQAADARVHRQLAAEEKAMKLPVKMIAPMAVFILPATFIVVLGSALMNLGKTI
jgi:tight adherence protein C